MITVTISVGWRRGMWAVPTGAALLLVLATLPSNHGAEGLGITAQIRNAVISSGPTASHARTAAHGPKASAGPTAASTVASQPTSAASTSAGDDDLADAFAALAKADGYHLTADVQQRFDGDQAAPAHVELWVRHRRSGQDHVLASGTTGASDDGTNATLHIRAADGHMRYSVGDSEWTSLPYSGPADVLGAFGLYDEWGWLQAARMDKALRTHPGPNGSVRASIDPAWLNTHLSQEGLGMSAVSADYVITTSPGSDGPSFDIQGNAHLSLGDRSVRTVSHLVVHPLPPGATG